MCGETHIELTVDEKAIIKRDLYDSTAPTTVMDEMPRVVKSLQRYATGLANVRIVFWSNAHRSMADRIVAAFQLAGWDVNHNRTAQEIRNPNHFSGIEVRGFNTQLIKVVAAAVTALGGWDVRSNLDKLEIPRDNPKWPRSQEAVYITIGYPAS